jgi:uncharacterized membrane protein YfhO
MLALNAFWYPDWVAYVGGQRYKAVAANGAHMAVAVPQGRHTVVFRFEPTYLRWLLAASGLALLSLLGLLVAATRSRAPLFALLNEAAPRRGS